MNIKKQPEPKAKKYIYTLKGPNPLVEGMILSFREDNRESADSYARSEALIFGKDTKANFAKEI